MGEIHFLVILLCNAAGARSGRGAGREGWSEGSSCSRHLVGMASHVELKALTELVLAKHRVHHVDHGRALAGANGVEHLFHLLGVLDGHDDGVRGAQTVQALRGRGEEDRFRRGVVVW